MYILTRRWLFALAVLGLPLTVFYIGYALWSVPRGGGLIGYVLGYLATGLVVFLMLLPIRKRQYQRPVGPLDLWMRSHVFLGILATVLVGMHAGFIVMGTISIALTVVFVLTVISGVLGTVFYEWFPRTIARMGNNAFRQELIAEQMADIEKEMEAIQKGQSEQFAQKTQEEFSRRRVPKTLNPVQWLRWRKNQHTASVSASEFSEGEQPLFHAAQSLILHHQQLGRQFCYQHLLRRWLWTHIPLSAALITFLLVHILSELYY